MPRDPKPWYRKDRDCWFVTIDGKRHNLGNDKKKAFDTFYAMMNRPSDSAVVNREVKKTEHAITPRIAVVADLFLEWSSKHRSPDTYEWYRYRLERFCQRYPELCFGELKPHHVQQWVDSYHGFTQTSKRNYIRSVKRCCKWAKKQGYIDFDPIDGLEVPGSEAREICINKDDFARICRFIQVGAFLTLCKVCFETGCRPQEILRVQVEHFDEPNQRWVLPPSKAKGKKKPRIVYLSPFAFETTREYVAQHVSGHVFRNANGKPWTTDAVNCSFTRLQIRMGNANLKGQGIALDSLVLAELAKQGRKLKSIKQLSQSERKKLRSKVARDHAPRYSLYALRHSWATNALEAGIDALTVATLMGHSDPSTLARVYSHIAHNPDHMRKQALKAIGG